jgi:predicted enzyme related to lactoylglutathione lyase
MVAKINNDAIEVGIVVRDAEGMLAFYRDTLGLEYLGDLEFPGTHMWRFQAGGSVVKLLAQDPPAAPAGDPTAGFSYLSLFVSNIDEIVDEVAAAGGSVAIPVTQFRPGARFAMAQDPEGNRLEFLDVAGLVE